MAPPSAGPCTCSSGENPPENHESTCVYRRKLDPPPPLAPEHRSETDWEKLRRCISSSGKGFAIGAGIKGGLAAFSILARLRSRKLSSAASARSDEMRIIFITLHFSEIRLLLIFVLFTGFSFLKAGIVSDREALATALKETIRYGLFLGTFAGTFVCVDECIAAFGGHDRLFISFLI